MTFLAAVVQLTSTEDPKTSMDEAERLVRLAAERGAQLVALPENVNFMGTEAEKQKLAEPLDGATFGRLASLAEALSIWLVAGTLPERGEEEHRAYNTSCLFGPDGHRAATYRKIHLFDIALGEGATHKESTHVIPGPRPVLARTPLAAIGMSVCYDLRFPDLYRSLRRAGAEILTVPAAFTVPTGRDHWEVLIRGRAIENQCYMLAPAQHGKNTERRRTYGRAMIVDPWGTVLAVCPDRPSVALAELDLSVVHDLRERIPCLSHEQRSIYEAVEISEAKSA